MRQGPLGCALLVCLGIGAQEEARASHLVTFVNGGTLEVEAYRIEGSQIVLTLAGGGEIAFPPRQVSGIVKAAPAQAPLPPPVAPAPAPAAPEVQPGPALPKPAGPIVISPWDPEPGVRSLIHEVATAHQVDARLVEALVEVESKFDPYAVSRRGAMGLMQLMPATARRLQVKDVFDPRQNVEGGVRYLRELLDRYRDTALALAAYNAGEDAVNRYGGIPPYRETRGYVTSILKRWKS